MILQFAVSLRSDSQSLDPFNLCDLPGKNSGAVLHTLVKVAVDEVLLDGEYLPVPR